MPRALAPPRFQLLKAFWELAFADLLGHVKGDLLLVSPFIKTTKTREIVSRLEVRGVTHSVRVSVLTNLDPMAVLSGATDLEALAHLGSHLSYFHLTHLPSLHAKVYVADSSMAIITSANLTDAGISRNIEYGVVSTDETVVAELRRDFEGYTQLGARIEHDELGGLLDEIRDLKKLYRQAERTIRSQARKTFEAQLDLANTRLFRYRAQGRTTQSLLSETILFLLRRGPLRTAQLHPLIQQIHPDICDDRIDRVIDGVHFGKRWKHYVRSAQQVLKRRGRVRFDGEFWHLVQPEVPG